MTDATFARMLLEGNIVALIVVLMLIFLRPKNPPKPQHPLPAKDLDTIKAIVSPEEDQYSH